MCVWACLFVFLYLFNLKARSSSSFFFFFFFFFSSWHPWEQYTFPRIEQSRSRIKYIYTYFCIKKFTKKNPNNNVFAFSFSSSSFVLSSVLDSDIDQSKYSHSFILYAHQYILYNIRMGGKKKIDLMGIIIK